MTQSSIRTGTSTSVTIVARSLFRERRSVAARTFSRCLPFSSVSARAISSSTEPNVWTSFAAVFSPTPGTPGMLSEVSPLSATYSR